MSQPGKQTLATHIAQYLKKKRQSDNEIWSVNNIFLEKSFSKCGAETNLRPFFKKSRLSISLDQDSLKFYTVCFY